MIKDRIREDMKAAMRAHDAAGLSTIRLLLAAIKQREVDEQIEADDPLGDRQDGQAASGFRAAVSGG